MLCWELPRLLGPDAKQAICSWGWASPSDSRCLLPERLSPNGLQPLKKFQEKDLHQTLLQPNFCRCGYCLISVNGPASFLLLFSVEVAECQGRRGGTEPHCAWHLLRAQPAGSLTNTILLPPLSFPQQPWKLWEVRSIHCPALIHPP